MNFEDLVLFSKLDSGIVSSIKEDSFKGTRKLPHKQQMALIGCIKTDIEVHFNMCVTALSIMTFEQLHKTIQIMVSKLPNESEAFLKAVNEASTQNMYPANLFRRKIRYAVSHSILANTFVNNNVVELNKTIKKS